MSEEKKSEEIKRDETKSSTGLESNMAGVLSYMLGWLTGLIFSILEEKDEYVLTQATSNVLRYTVSRT